jgi:serine/threonine-protein phosphatase 2A regulatory subunit A
MRLVSCAILFLSPQDSVRLQTTENCVSFGRVIGELVTSEMEEPLTENELALIQRLLPLIVATIDDRSWRVRWTAAAKFANVIKAYNPIPGAMDALIPAYEKLLQDPEAEVRTAATFNLALVAHGCKAKVLPPMGLGSEDEMADATTYKGERITSAERLVKRVTSLTEDDSEHVRAALAMVATELAPILGKDATITHLVPPILLLLRDAASEVRLNLISSLESLNKVIGVDLLSQSLLPAILDLAQDGKWRYEVHLPYCFPFSSTPFPTVSFVFSFFFRIRLAIIHQIPLLAKQLGKDFFTDKLSSICVNWLGDDIATIRDAATTNLKELTSLFGTEWACDNLIPHIDEIRHNSSYLRRLTAVQACARMAGEMDPAIAQIEVLPILLEMATDPVPNIRFNVAQSLGNLGSIYDVTTYDQQVLPVLSLLQEDLDRDVRFYADKASAKLEEEYANKK